MLNMPQDGLINYWSLKNTLEDTIGGLNLQKYGSGNYTMSDEGLYLDGNEGLKTLSNYNFPSKFTLMISVKNIVHTGMADGIIGTGFGNSGWQGFFYGIILGSDDSLISNTAGSISPLKKDQWIDLIIKCDGIKTYLYVNGVKVLSGSNWINQNSPLTIGGMSNSPINSAGCNFFFIKGYVKDVAIYNKALSDNDIYSMNNSNLKTDIKDVKIGDHIPCSYVVNTSGTPGTFSELGTSQLDFIPIASSATPNGGFHWIYVGKDYLGRKKFIADRVLQHSISWNALNSVGICDEKEIDNFKYTLNNIPKMTSNNSSSPCVAIGTTTNPSTHYYAYDNNESTYTNSGVTGNEWLGIDYGIGNEKANAKIGIKFYQGYTITNGNIEASNDGINWVTIKSGLSFIDNGLYQTIKWEPPTIKYRFWRINSLGSTYTGNAFLIYTMELFEQLYSYNNDKYTIKLLNSGNLNTDLNSEWDQIIVNSTLNNTIIAGDNNVWNWNGISSWTNTTQQLSIYGNNGRIIRGGNVDGLSGATNSKQVNAFAVRISTDSVNNNGFRPVLLIELVLKAPLFNGNLLSSSIHIEDTILTGSITDINIPNQKVQYKILINDIQIYPESGYTDLMVSPVSINYTISNNLLIQNQNKITVITNNESNKSKAYNFYATLYNNAPNGILTLSDITTHNTNIELTGNITDTDLDKISYKISINNIEVLPFATFFTDPYVDYTILNKDLVIGDNIIKVEYKDNFKNSLMGSWESIITKTNNTSIINCQYINGSILGVITDPDSDSIQYKILINGTQKYPINDYTEFNQVCNINYQINRNDILINQNNIITIEAKDNLGTNILQNITFIGDYVGLMFMDEQKQFYTTDIGELLKYLDFGTITLGQITDPIKVLVQNKYGFKIKDINLNINNILPNVNVEFSKEENPFIATSNLKLEKEYAINEIDYFYIRLNTSISSNSVNGTFKITAKATPLA